MIAKSLLYVRDKRQTLENPSGKFDETGPRNFPHQKCAQKP